MKAAAGRRFAAAGRELRVEVRTLLWWLAWLLAVLPVAWRRVTTSDAWWHVALGRWIWSHRSFPDFTQWYFTPAASQVPDLRWTWLGDLCMAGVHALGGAGGLQILSLACLATACVLLRRLAPAEAWWTSWPVLVALALGTYQLQLPRNAVFSMPLLAWLFWIFFAPGGPSRRRRWQLIPMATLWGVLHGSYPLAVVLPALLLIGEWIDDRVAGRAGAAPSFAYAALLVAGCTAAVSVANPEAGNLLVLPIHQALHAHGKTPRPRQSAPRNVLETGQAVQNSPPTASPHFGQSAKRWLNGLLWTSGPGGVRSGDFASPFDYWGYRAVPAAFALAGLALLRLAFASTWRWSWGLVLAALTVLGCAYLRMTGYLALGAAACLLGGPPLRLWVAGQVARSSRLLAQFTALAAGAAWVLTCQDRLGALLGKASHEFGWGAVAIFDDSAADWVLAKFPSAPTFTTIASGSHAEMRWAGRKPVFIDGFFAPHPPSLWTAYRKAAVEENPVPLVDHYGIELALIEHTRAAWGSVFLNSPDWRPVAIGRGEMVFARRRLPGTAEPVALLVSAREAGQLSPYFRHALATEYFSALLALVLAGETDSARTLRNQDPELFALLRPCLAAPQQAAAEAVAQALDGRLEIRARPPGQNR